MFKKLWPYLAIAVIVLIFFWQVFLKGLLPIPADTIVGLYHPYRDLYSNTYPNGIPFKNFLITDPVRQEYPWKKFSLESLRQFEIPSWNPYSLSGTPHAANFQSGVFYPINLLSFLLPFKYFWTFYIILSPLLAGFFMLLYLRNLKLGNLSSLFGAIVFSFSGFSTTWLEWGNILHTALWLPLILLSIDKIASPQEDIKILGRKLSSVIAWGIILTIALSFSFFAGHLQTFFYITIIAIAYSVLRLHHNWKKEIVLPILGSFLIFVLITAFQWIPTLRFINLSARYLDQNFLTTPGWFLPWQNIIQFLIPDFFGNPSTLNYWGVWNYGELTGYASVIAIVLAAFAVFFKRSKEIAFFLIIGVVAMIFALPDLVAKIPFMLGLPFISSAQPTRLLFIVDFCMATLAAIGFDYVGKKIKMREAVTVIGVFSVIFVLIFALTQQNGFFGANPQNLAIAQRNMILPAAIFVLTSILLVIGSKLNRRYMSLILLVLIVLTAADLFRFSWKFNTFSPKEYLFPQTKTLTFLQKNLGNYRFSTDDPRIMPPNFSLVYGLESVEGYDSLYLTRYGEFVAALNRNKPDISPPFGFNRIVRVTNYNSELYDLLGIKYLLSFSEINNPKFVQVEQEGQTRVYENQNVLPRAFLAQDVLSASSKQSAINKMFDRKFDPVSQAVVEGAANKTFNTQGSVAISLYSPNKIELKTETDRDGFLVLTDANYPTWRVTIDGKLTKIYQTDYIFRGVFVPKGTHTVTFYNSAL